MKMIADFILKIPLLYELFKAVSRFISEATKGSTKKYLEDATKVFNDLNNAETKTAKKKAAKKIRDLIKRL